MKFARWHLLKCAADCCDRADSELVGKCQCVDINAKCAAAGGGSRREECRGGISC